MRSHIYYYILIITLITTLMTSSCSDTPKLADYLKNRGETANSKHFVLLFVPTENPKINSNVIRLAAEYEKTESVIFEKLIVGDQPISQTWKNVSLLSKEFPQDVGLMLFSPKGEFRGQWEFSMNPEHKFEDINFMKGLYSFHKGINSNFDLINLHHPQDYLTTTKFLLEEMKSRGSQSCMILPPSQILCKDSNSNIIKKYLDTFEGYNLLFFAPDFLSDEDINIIAFNYSINPDNFLRSSKLSEELESMRKINLNSQYTLTVSIVSGHLTIDYILPDCQFN